MRHLAISTFCLGLLLSPAHSQDWSPSRPTAVAQISAPESRIPTHAEPPPAESPTSVAPSTNPVDVTCQTLGSAAIVNDLPIEFLTRLIWQESRFDTRAVSRAGAQGIAQFMPGTAAWVGLIGVAATIRLGDEMFPRQGVGWLAGAALAALNVVIHLIAVLLLRKPFATGLVATAQLGVPAAIATLGLSEHVLSAGVATAIVAAALVSLGVCTVGVGRLVRMLSPARAGRARPGMRARSGRRNRRRCRRSPPRDRRWRGPCRRWRADRRARARASRMRSRRRATRGCPRRIRARSSPSRSSRATCRACARWRSRRRDGLRAPGRG